VGRRRGRRGGERPDFATLAGDRVRRKGRGEGGRCRRGCLSVIPLP
jgi:hypothetical protein